MNALFEDFRLLVEAVGDWGVALDFQTPSSSVVRRSDGGPYRRLIPDTLATIGDSAVRVPIDAKYKRYSNKKLDPGDIAQTFIYAAGLGAPQLPHALIVYPSETRRSSACRSRFAIRTAAPAAALTRAWNPGRELLDEVSASMAQSPLLGEIAESVLAAAEPADSAD